MRLKLNSFCILVSVILITGCSDGESLVMNSCQSQAMPSVICECTYDDLSENYSDGDIKKYFKDIQKAEMTGALPNDKEFQAFVINMTNSFESCMTPYY